MLGIVCRWSHHQNGYLMELVPNEIIRPMFILWALNGRHKLRHCYLAAKIMSEAHFLFQDFKSNITELPESSRAIGIAEIFIMLWEKVVLTKLPAKWLLYTNRTNKIQHKNQEENQLVFFFFFNAFSQDLILNVQTLTRQKTCFTSEVKPSMHEQGYARIVHYDKDDTASEHGSVGRNLTMTLFSSL